MCYIHIVIANIDRCCHGTYYLLKRNEGLLSKENVVPSRCGSETRKFCVEQIRQSRRLRADHRNVSFVGNITLINLFGWVIKW